MNEQSYQIAFSGDALAGFALAQVKQNLARVFKLNAPKTQAMFNGRKHVLKKNLDLVAAKKYRAAMMKLGADVSIEAAKVGQVAQQTARVASVSGFASSALADNSSQARQSVAAKAAADCASKPVALVNVAKTTNRATSPEPSVITSEPARPLSFVEAEKPLSRSNTNARPEQQFSATVDLKKSDFGKTVALKPGALKPSIAANPQQKNDSTTGRRSALEDLQLLLEKTRSKNKTDDLDKSLVSKSNQAPKKIPTPTRPLQKGSSLSNKNTTQAAAVDAKPSSLQALNSKLASENLLAPTPKRAPKKNPMLTNPLLMGIKQKHEKLAPVADKAKLLQQAQPQPKPKLVATKPAVVESKNVEPQKTDQKIVAKSASPQTKSLPLNNEPAQKASPTEENIQALQEPLSPTESDTSQIIDAFEQPTLLSCIICGQTQHKAPHCLNCNSVFEAEADGVNAELEKLLGHEDFEHTPLEKVLWPGVTVLLFLYTLIFNFNLPLITFWVPDDTLDELITVELTQACHGAKPCLAAVGEQLDDCIKKSGIYSYKPTADKRVDLGGYLDKISSCIVDVNKKPFFGVGADTPFKNLQ